MTTPRVLRVGLAVALTLATAPALADPPPPPPAVSAAADPVARAADLKKAGDDAMDSLHFAAALEAYQAAYALAPQPALLYNEGRALQALNRHPEALTKIEAFKATAPKDVLAKVPDLDKLIVDLRAHVGTLGVSCNVPGARVLVDRTVVGTTPLANRLELNAGQRTVDVEAEGYFPFHQVVNVGPGEATSVQITLLASANGVLFVNGSSPGAEVTLDGADIGVAPAERVVTAGTHTLLLRHPDYADTDASVVVEAGQRKVVLVTLQGKPVTSRWWFWTSLGAAVATGVAVTAAAVSPRSPDNGSIPPGRLTSMGFGARVAIRF